MKNTAGFRRTRLRSSVKRVVIDADNSINNKGPTGLG